MPRSYTKSKGRGKGQYLALPHSTINHPNFRSLSGTALKLLVDIAAMYNGKNNGDFSTAAKVMQSRGWTSNSTITRARRELEEKGFLVQTRLGGRTRCGLYAITWWPIDECDGKLDIAASRRASNDWKNRFCTPESGAL